jgi:hypothetical protein
LNIGFRIEEVDASRFIAEVCLLTPEDGGFDSPERPCAVSNLRQSNIERANNFTKNPFPDWNDRFSLKIRDIPRQFLQIDHGNGLKDIISGKQISSPAGSPWQKLVRAKIMGRSSGRWLGFTPLPPEALCLSLESAANHFKRYISIPCHRRIE